MYTWRVVTIGIKVHSYQPEVTCETVQVPSTTPDSDPEMK